MTEDLNFRDCPVCKKRQKRLFSSITRWVHVDTKSPECDTIFLPVTR